MSTLQYMLKLAFRNVFRNKRRSFLTMVVIMFSVGTFLFMQTYFAGFLNNAIEDSIKITGHLTIQHPEYELKERMMSLSVPVENYSRLVDTVRNIPGIKSAAGRIKFGGLLDFGENNEPGLGMGIDPAAEREVMQLENSIVDGAYFTGGERETVIGLEFSKKLGIDVGDTITVISRTAYSSLAAENLVVVGIADLLSSMLNRIFYMPLPTAQRLLDMEDKAAEMVIYLERPEEVGDIKQKLMSLPDIKDTYTIYAWQEKGFIQDILPVLNIAIGIMIVLFGSIAGFSIINTMLMAVLERTNEIGVLTAFGMKRRNVLSVFLSEAFLIGVFGGILGLIVGGGFSYWLEVHGITLGEVVEDMPFPIRQVIYGDLQWIHAVYAFTIGLVLSVISAFLPALKAARLQPTDALRHH